MTIVCMNCIVYFEESLVLALGGGLDTNVDLVQPLAVLYCFAPKEASESVTDPP